MTTNGDTDGAGRGPAPTYDRRGPNAGPPRAPGRGSAPPPGASADSPEEVALFRRLQSARRQRQRSSWVRRGALVGVSAGVGVFVGVAGMALVDGERPLESYRVAVARWLLPEPLRHQALDTETPRSLASAQSSDPTELELETIEARAAEVEERVLAMLAESALALRQIEELDRLRASAIDELSVVGRDPESLIIDMIAASGALETSLAGLQALAPSGDGTGRPPPVPEQPLGAFDPSRALDELHAVDAARADVLAFLADNTSGDKGDALRRIGETERALNLLAAYVDQVVRAIELGDAGELQPPPLDELEQVGDATVGGVPLREMVARAEALHRSATR